MNRLFCKLLVASLCVVSFAACSDDDDPEIIVNYPDIETQFSVTDGNLALTYNGEVLLGKTVRFVPDAADNTKATLVLEGEPLSFADMASKADNQPAPSLRGCGVLPGSGSLSLPVVLDKDGKFSGSSSTAACTFDYAGSVGKDAMSISLSNVKLTNTHLAGTRWQLTPLDIEGSIAGFEDTPVHISWVSDKTLPLDMGFGPMPMAPEQVLFMALAFMPQQAPEGVTIPDDITVMDGQINLYDYLRLLLRDVTFAEDGNIIANYMDLDDKKIQPSPKGLAQYMVNSDNKSIQLYLNIPAIVADAARSRQADLSALIPTVISAYGNMLTEGVPVVLSQCHDGGMTVMLDTSFFRPLFPILQALLSDETLRNAIVESMTQDENFADMAPMVSGMLAALPEVLGGTSKLEIGLHLQPLN